MTKEKYDPQIAAWAVDRGIEACRHADMQSTDGRSKFTPQDVISAAEHFCKWMREMSSDEDTRTDAEKHTEEQHRKNLEEAAQKETLQ